MLGPLGRVPRDHSRRSRMPLINSSRPSGSRSRRYSGASRRSISSLVTISSGSV
jgi:hypothetical protein